MTLREYVDEYGMQNAAVRIGISRITLWRYLARRTVPEGVHKQVLELFVDAVG